MQYLSRQCIRLTSLCRSSAAQTAVHNGSQIATASNSGHKAYTALPSMTSWMVSHSVQQPGRPDYGQAYLCSVLTALYKHMRPLAGASFASEAAAEPTAVQTPTAPAQTLSKGEFAKLSLQQKKAIMKPDKNRNHFKRMWKRDMQIRVMTQHALSAYETNYACHVQHHVARL